MNRWIVASLLLIAACGSLEAAIDAPDHVIYGNASLFGNPAPSGQLIQARLLDRSETLVAYQLGRDVRLGGQYALKIPMDAVNPRLEQTARPGDPIEIFMDGQLAARTVVGAIGTAVRLDIDPQFLGSGPSVTVDGVEVFEGNSGLTPMVFPARLNTTSSEVVTVSWETIDDTAIGGESCATGVDFIAASGQLIFAPGTMEGAITVSVCANTDIQPTRQLRVRFIGVENGVLAQGEVIGVIIDDDDIPELRMADVTVIKPVSGQTVAIFRPKLSKRSDYEVRLSYSTQDLNAIAGLDYSAVSGQLVIPPDALEAEIVVPILPSVEVSPPRDFLLRLDNAFNVSFNRETALGRISDARFEPAVELAQEMVDGDVVNLARPTSLAIVPGGDQVYVSSDALDAVALFSRNPLTGRLDWVELFDNSSSGLVGANIDGPLDIQLSPDGLNLYVASARNNSIIVLARDPASGALDFIERISATAQPGLGGVRRLLVSPDGRHVYAAGAQANALVAFARDSGDNGTLSALQVEVNCTDVSCADRARWLLRPSGLALSPDSATLYVASRSGNAVQAYRRNVDPGADDFGKVSLVAEYRSGSAGIVDLSGAVDLAVSPDGAQLYVSAEGEDAVARFNRNGDGTLAQQLSSRHATPELPGLRGPQGLALSPNGDRLYVAGFSDSTLTIFDRLLEEHGERRAGELDIRQTVFDDQGGVTAMGGPTRVIASDDNRHIYVVANTDDAIVVLRRLPVAEEDDRVFGDDFTVR